MREFIDGATAIVRGALAGGCNFFAGYPITPATPILLQLVRELPKVGGVAIQGEDEIASMGICLGAAASGMRALTATSGPGLSLYSENIGLALLAEVPLVIVDVQRLGPATGGATTVGQGDTHFARWGTAGGYPLPVLAPSSVNECMTLTAEAFAWAQKFSCPVIVLTDKELNLTTATVEVRPLPEPPSVPMVGAAGKPPYGAGSVVRITGSTHDGEGHITKDPARVEALNRRLWEKIMAHRDELERVRLDLQPGAKTLVLSFGVTARAMEDAVALARAEGQVVSSAVVQSLWPVPEQALHRAVAGVERIIVAELNPGLYVQEIAALFPGVEVVSLSRIDGQLIAPQQFLTLLNPA